MKSLLQIIFFLFATQSFGQQFQNEKVLYYYEKSVTDIHFTTDSNLVITTGGLQDDLIWNLEKKEAKSKIQTYRYGESMMNASGTEMCTVGGQHYVPETKEITSSSLSFYSIETNETTVQKFTDLDLQRMCYHPTDDNILGVIGMDENFEYRAAIMDRTTFEITDIALQGKGSLIPLWMQFTPDGKYAYIGYGSGSYNGGFTVYNLELKKEIKRIVLKDQPLEFVFLGDGKFIMKGNKSSIIYNKDHSAISTHTIRLPAVHPSGKYGIHFNNDKEAFFYFFETKTKVKLDLPILLKQDFSNVNEFHGYAKFNPNGKQLAIKYYKWHSSKTQTTSEYPSFMVYDILTD